MNRSTTHSAGRCALVLATLLGVLAPAALAQRADREPAVAQQIKIDQKPGAQIPLDAKFVDERGRPVRLADYFDGKKPVILTLNYFRCPMLCGLQLNGLLDALKQMSWTAGDQFTILTVSFDPLETPKLAKLKQDNYLLDYGRPDAVNGWHFLTGDKVDIQRLTRAVGFNYRWMPERNEWAHSSALIFCTPDGKVARYLADIVYDPKTLRLTLVEASKGKVGSVADLAFLWCFHYDDTTGQYTPAVTKIMQVGGVATAVGLGILVLVLWRREARRSRLAAAGATQGTV